MEFTLFTAYHLTGSRFGEIGSELVCIGLSNGVASFAYRDSLNEVSERVVVANMQQNGISATEVKEANSSDTAE